MDPKEKVLLYNGQYEEVENLKAGHELMSKDSTPAVVLDVYKGVDEMYEIVPARGKSFICNSRYVLHLISTYTPRVKTIKSDGRYRVTWWEGGRERSKTFSPINKNNYAKAVTFKDGIEHTVDMLRMPVCEYIKKSKSWRKAYKAYRSKGVDWDFKDVPFDPWVIGMWLGDGSANGAVISNTDEDILTALTNTITERIKYYGSRQWGISKDTAKRNVFTDALRELNLIKNKHIPLVYLANSRRIRLEILAGLMDSDGTYTCGCFVILQVRKRLSYDIVALARSLGFYTSIRFQKKQRPEVQDQYVMTICGENLNDIPCVAIRKQASAYGRIRDPSRFGFTVSAQNEGEYVGFTLDNEASFLLEDHTITS